MTIQIFVTKTKLIFIFCKDCCVEQGVSPECMDVCSLDIDIETALTRPKCFADLDKLMNCAAGMYPKTKFQELIETNITD